MDYSDWQPLQIFTDLHQNLAENKMPQRIEGFKSRIRGVHLITSNITIVPRLQVLPFSIWVSYWKNLWLRLSTKYGLMVMVSGIEIAGHHYSWLKSPKTPTYLLLIQVSKNIRIFFNDVLYFPKSVGICKGSVLRILHCLLI